MSFLSAAAPLRFLCLPADPLALEHHPSGRPGQTLRCTLACRNSRASRGQTAKRKKTEHAALPAEPLRGRLAHLAVAEGAADLLRIFLGS